MEPTNDREERLLKALAWMAVQYLEAGEQLDNQCMSAGEGAMQLLEEYGLVIVANGGRYGAWTDAGRQFLKAL
jgi:hypothetical protein